MMHKPAVSVVMSVYNATAYLEEALASIFRQSFRDWEFIVVDDGSTDDSWKQLSAVPDNRVRISKNPVNLGLAASLNRGISLAKGDFIARMDADDISDPRRLEYQLRHMLERPDIALLGTNYIIIDTHGREIDRTDLFTHPDDLKTALVVSNQFGHGSVMIRRDVLHLVKGYNEDIEVEDYDLWTRISRVATVANLDEHLYTWRSHAAGWTERMHEKQMEITYRIRDREFIHLLDHRTKYKAFSLHSTNSSYLKKKSYMLRDLAYLAQREGRWRVALAFMIVSTLIAPWLKGNYFYLLLLLTRPRKFIERVPYVYVA